MTLPTNQRGMATHGGFTLPGVMVVAAAVLTLAIGLLLVVSIERRTARSHVERQRAELAARAGMEELRSVLLEQAANDSFMVIEHRGPKEPGDDRQAPAHLYLVNGSSEGGKTNYRYHPLFSTSTAPPQSPVLEAPDPEPLVNGQDSAEISALPWQQAACIAWIPIRNREGKIVARYAYWTEDLQGKVSLGGGGDQWPAETTGREAWPHPAPGVPATPEGPETELALHALDPKVLGDENSGEVADRVLRGRPLMVTPDSVLAAAEFTPPFERDADGRLSDPSADALERNVAPIAMPYDEQPIVPFDGGIDASVAGRPKLNLNRLLADPRDSAINEFSEWVNDALPEFRDRQGGFPEDYLRTLAAGAFDYADADHDPSIGGDHRGIDGFPMLSEVFLHIHYRGLDLSDPDRKYMLWTFKVFAELWNMSNLHLSGDARLSYENGLGTTGIGALPQGLRFDHPGILSNPGRSTHELTRIGDGYWSPPVDVSLRPDEYGTYEFITVDYRMDVGPRSGPGSQFIEEFALVEPLGAAGISLKWGNKVVDRTEKIVRDSHNLEFVADKPEHQGEASIPGHSYGPYGDHFNNMGDPRISYYIRTKELGENAYPENISPNRRNVRQRIYAGDAATKPKHYGRVLPSEWPDGGHNSQVGTWPASRNDAYTPLHPMLLGSLPVPDAGFAPQRISNAGRFYSAVELGRVFDPVMWSPVFPDLPGEPGSGVADTKVLNGRWPKMPARRDRWPKVAEGASPSDRFGGGTTLCIGSEEHPKFDNPRQHAALLLDLFHTGKSRSESEPERTGPTIRIDGQINLNTAPEDAIRVMAFGLLGQDPELARVVERQHQGAPSMAPRVVPMELGTPTRERASDLIADALVAARPFAGAYGIATAEDGAGRRIFGNRALYQLGDDIQWNDAAAEELFGRICAGTTLRSRNFRVWVVGQSIAPTVPGSAGTQKVLAESRLVFTVFANPGERDAEGRIVASNYMPEILYENGF